MPEKEAPFDPRLMCGVASLSYDFLAREGRLDMPAGHCCDMTGAVTLFTGIDPKVKVIRTFAGGEPDTVYRKRLGGSPDWYALPSG